MDTTSFDFPFYALANNPGSDPLEMSEEVAIADFGNLGRCVMLYQKKELAADSAVKLGYKFVFEVDDIQGLTLILDAAKGKGCSHVAVDYIRVPDGQAVHFFSLDEMFVECKLRLGLL